MSIIALAIAAITHRIGNIKIGANNMKLSTGLTSSFAGKGALRTATPRDEGTLQPSPTIIP